MEQISFFLGKFRTLGLDAEFAKRAFVETVDKILRVKISPGSVELKQDTFFVKTSPALKNELFIKRGQVLAELSKTFGLKERKIL